jgi:hypothetical protein
MATSKKTSFIEMELEWLEMKAEELRAYCDSNNIASLDDRRVGNKVTATIEQQIKSIRETLQDYIKIIDAIEKLREKEVAKKSLTRGDQELTPIESGEIN